MIILGISGGLGHDPAAAIVIEGELVAAAEEERFVRRKGAPGLPALSSAKYCLSSASLTLTDVDAVALGWDPELDPNNQSLTERVTDFFKDEHFRGELAPRIIPVDHHIAHAAASFFLSGFPDAAILVMDGTGERSATTLAVGRGTKIEVLRRFEPHDSLGFFYQAATRYLGLGKRGEGKTMGLAALGKPVFEFPNIRLTEDGYTLGLERPSDASMEFWKRPIRSEWQSIFAATGLERNAVSYSWIPEKGNVRRTAELGSDSANFAASVQEALQRVVHHLTQLLLKETSSKNLVLGGGTALNCTCNGIIRKSSGFSDLFVFPGSHDAGTAIGAALFVAAQHGEVNSKRIQDVYLGPSFVASDIYSMLKSSGIRFKEFEDVGSGAAELICEGKVIGWLTGRMEFGPRALGHRSILADPTDPSMTERVNRLKGREQWRPLAPSILWEDAQNVFDMSAPSPFMLEATFVSKEFSELIPATIHIDGSSRPQTVNSDEIGPFTELLTSMGKNLGVSAVLNTSFNLEFEPIVCSPFDALRTFISSELDHLVIESFLISKD